MQLPSSFDPVRGKSFLAFTLMEVCFAAGISALTIGSIIYGYINATQRAEWTAYSNAAEALAAQRLEQTRSCRYDPNAPTPVDELITNNFPTVTNALDIPISGTNVVWATNYTTITTVSANPPVKCIVVDCVWRWYLGNKIFTNTVFTYRAPDN